MIKDSKMMEWIVSSFQQHVMNGCGACMISCLAGTADSKSKQCVKFATHLYMVVRLRRHPTSQQPLNYSVLHYSKG